MECGMTTHGAYCSIEVDTDEPVGSVGLRATITGTRETTLDGGLKNSSKLVGTRYPNHSLSVGHKVLKKEYLARVLN
ncbi:hypothetical protein Tco_1076323 [Tanacetum coccineum]